MAEMAWELSIGRSLTYALVRDPEGPPVFRVGRGIRVRRVDLEEWLEERKRRGMTATLPIPKPKEKRGKEKA